MEKQLEEYIIWAFTNNRSLADPIPGSFPPLLLAAAAGLGNMTRTLLSFDADPDTQDAKSGWTSLMLAAELGYLSVVNELLAKDADVDYKVEGTGAQKLFLLLQYVTLSF